MPMLTTLALLAAAAAAASPGEHRVEIDHRGQPVSVHYSGDVAVAHRQVGAATPGGVASTLRCNWTASVVVNRLARHPAGAVMSRTVPAAETIRGSRPGWCAGQRGAIDREVAARAPEMRDHLLAVAAADRAVLLAEIDGAGIGTGG